MPSNAWKVEVANVRLRPGSLDRSHWLRTYRHVFFKKEGLFMDVFVFFAAACLTALGVSERLQSAMVELFRKVHLTLFVFKKNNDLFLIDRCKKLLRFECA